MKESLIDIPVLLLFFVREEQTAKVFEAIKKARPSKLYLYQDGPREGREDDIINAQKCRDVVEDIDWECEVHKHYCEKNQGCDPSEFLAQKWMFETEEYGIILEDDDVPSQSFFPFCKELLEKYKDDERIHMVCGYNPIDVFDNTEYDYCFSRVASIWGWATWKRVVDMWDENYTWLDDPERLNAYLSTFKSKHEKEWLIDACRRHKKSGIAYYETINNSSLRLNNRVAINPKYNMISNIGIANESTHSVSNIDLLPNSVKKLFYKKTYEYKFPLKHPNFVTRNTEFENMVDVALGNTFRSKVEKKISHMYNIVRYGGVKLVISKIKGKTK